MVNQLSDSITTLSNLRRNLLRNFQDNNVQSRLEKYSRYMSQIPTLGNEELDKELHERVLKRMDQEQFLDVSDNVVLDLADADNQREREVAKRRKDYNQARFESLLKSEQLKMRKREMEERRRAIWEEEDENSKEAIKISKTPLTFGQKAEYRFHPSRDPRVQIAKAKEATEQKKIQLAADVEQ
jgi:hypothetical protein